MIYLLSGRGTLHKATRTAGGNLTYEADNLDVADVKTYEALSEIDPRQIKRMCRRCFPA